MDCVTDVESMLLLLRELGYEQTEPTWVFEDNQLAIALIGQSPSHQADETVWPERI